MKNLEFYKKLDYDKININWNKNPIEMKLFMSFLTVSVDEIKEHLGSSTGWTQYENDKYKLTIGGGWVNKVEYLDSLQFGENLHNPYQNYVNPFFLFDIFTKQGKSFFIEYYKDDFKEIIKNSTDKIKSLNSKLKYEKELKLDILNLIKELKAI